MKIQTLPELSNTFSWPYLETTAGRRRGNLACVRCVIILFVAFISCSALQSQTLRTDNDTPRDEMMDLVADALTASPAHPLAGERVRIEFSVTNRSDNPANKVQITFIAGTEKAGSTTLNIGPRQSVSTSFDWTAGPEGVQKLQAIVDPDRRFVEENFADNVAGIDVIVAAPNSGSADFSVSSLELIKQDERQVLRATVTNHAKVSQSIPVVFMIDDRVIAVRYVSSLAAGQTTVVEVESTDFTPGRISVEVNPRFRNLAKHATTLTRTFTPSIDLSVETLRVTQSENSRGKQVTLSFRVTNAGAKPVSKSFRIAIFPGTVASGTLQTDFLTIPSLAAGETIYASRTINSPAGDSEVRIEVMSIT